MSERDHYASLHVTRDASVEQIKRNYLKLAKAFHPDTGDGDHDIAAEINAAWYVLQDTARRAVYDADLAANESDDTTVGEAEPAVQFEDAWGTEVPVARYEETVNRAPPQPWVPFVPEPPSDSRPPFVPPRPVPNIRHYLRGESPSSKIVGAIWLLWSVGPPVGLAVFNPGQSAPTLLPGGILIALSILLGRRRIVLRAMSSLYLMWVVMAMLWVAALILVVINQPTTAGWVGSMYALGWLVLYVLAVEWRRTELVRGWH